MVSIAKKSCAIIVPIALFFSLLFIATGLFFFFCSLKELKNAEIYKIDLKSFSLVSVTIGFGLSTLAFSLFGIRKHIAKIMSEDAEKERFAKMKFADIVSSKEYRFCNLIAAHWMMDTNIDYDELGLVKTREKLDILDTRNRDMNEYYKAYCQYFGIEDIEVKSAANPRLIIPDNLVNPIIPDNLVNLGNILKSIQHDFFTVTQAYLELRNGVDALEIQMLDEIIVVYYLAYSLTMTYGVYCIDRGLELLLEAIKGNSDKKGKTNGDVSKG